jgi:hypothetical protein
MGTSSYNSIHYNGKSFDYGHGFSDGHPCYAGIAFLMEIKELIKKYGLEEFIRLLKEIEFKKFETDVENKEDINGDKEENDVYMQSIFGSLEDIIKSKIGYKSNDFSGWYNYVLDLDTLTVGIRFDEEDETSLSDIDKLIESWKN